MADSDTIKEYSNGEITIIWKPALCIHSGRCVSGLPEVFNKANHPWTNANGASSEDIINQIHVCPSKALTYKKNI